MTELQWVHPEWPAPATVQAVATTRIGGVSQGVYAGLNLGLHVGDDPKAVAINRQLIKEALDLPEEPHWLDQQHGTEICQAGDRDRAADACVATRPGSVCAVLTADCLPVLLCAPSGEWVAAVHAGWRGVVGNILAAAVAAYPGTSSDLLAWIGPVISARGYEVDEPVCVQLDPSLAEVALQPSGPGHWWLDLVAAAKWQLRSAGVRQCAGGQWATDRQPQFYSHRREGVTGRMATLIWISEPPS